MKVRLVVNVSEEISNEIWRLQYQQKQTRSSVVEKILSDALKIEVKPRCKKSKATA